MHVPAATRANTGKRIPGGEAPSWRTLLEPAAPEGAAAAARYAHNVPAPDASRDRALELELRSLKEQVALLTKLALRPAPAELSAPSDDNVRPSSSLTVFMIVAGTKVLEPAISK